MCGLSCFEFENLATVITNLLSAIPWIGSDIVQLTNINIEIKSQNKFHNMNSFILPMIGKIGKGVRNKKLKTDIENENLLAIPYSFLSVLVGIIDGDGYIKVTKTTKGFIDINLTFALNIRDNEMLIYIQKILGIGRINTYSKNNEASIVKLIFNKTDLQETLFPLFIHHNLLFLIDRRIRQYNLALHVITKNITLYKDINPENIENNYYLLKRSPKDYKNFAFFYNWIVGLTIAEGSEVFSLKFMVMLVSR